MKKISDDDLSQIQSLREMLFEITTSLGELHLNKKILQNQILSVEKTMTDYEEKFSTFQDKERVLYDMFQTKYGTSEINLETGEIVE
jgi:hypothetical protein